MSASGVRHVVLFTWNQGATAQQVQDLEAALQRLPGLIPQIVDYRFGADLGINQGTADFAVVADFASMQDYLAYRDHPDHKQLISDYVTPIVASRMAVQFPR